MTAESRPSPLQLAVLAIALLWLWSPLRHAVLASMSGHMLLQLPLLFASGWAGATLVPLRARRCYAFIDSSGLTTMLFISFVAALWMIPATIDLALIDDRVATAKYVSWCSAGMVAGLGWQRLTDIMRLFLIGNLAWMLATAGLLYLEAEDRLCVNYLLDEQQVTGIGLIVFSMALLAFLMWLCHVRAPRSAVDPIESSA